MTEHSGSYFLSVLSWLWRRVFVLLFIGVQASVAWAACSADYHGLATINEIHKLSQGQNNERFIEIKILSSAITAEDYDSWTLSACTDNGCTGPISVSAMSDGDYPWIVAGNNLIAQQFIDLRGMDVVLRDGNSDTIDYVSVKGFDDQEDASCDPAYPWQASGPNNTKTFTRDPDGTGAWTAAPGASGGTTKGDTNNDGVNGPDISVDNAAVFQGEDAVFTVTLSESAPRDIQVDYETRDDTAVAGTDYSATSGTVVIASGGLSARITVPTLTSGSTESKRFYLTLSNARDGANQPFGVLVSQIGVGTILPEPLVTYRMEQSAWSGDPGEVLDTSGHGRDATALGGANTGQTDPAIPGNPGTCRYGEFDGRNDQLRDADAGDYLNGLEAVTVMAWVYNTAQLAGNDRGIFFTGNPSSGGRDNRFGLRYDTDGFFGNQQNVIKASISSDDCSANAECLQVETVANVMVRNDWQHVAMTWERGKSIKVFIDGVEVGISATEGSGGEGSLARVQRLDIGQGAKGERWEGRIDEFRIFGAALSADKIDQKRRLTFPCNIGPDHIRLSHLGTGLTCSPADISVTACADADCSTRFSDPVTVDFTSPSENWSPDPVTFTETTSVLLQYTTPGTFTLGAEAASPAATNPTRCFSGGAETCEMTFFDSGFIIDVPDHIAATTVGGTLAAVRKDDTSQRCVPGFSNVTRDVAFWSGYNDPDSGTASVTVDSQAIAKASPGTVTTLAFNTDGVASFDLAYPDAGRVGLNARYEGSEGNGDPGLVLIGVTDFIARPDRFVLDVPGNPAATDGNGNVFRTAAEAFEITVSALNAKGDVTPNFGRESTPESVRLENSLVAPAGGESPPITGAFGAFGEACDGTSAGGGTACGEFSWPEVGIIALTPRLADADGYLGFEDVVGSRLDNVGRFIPARFELTVTEPGMVDPFCTLGGLDFAYTGQSLSWQSSFEPVVTADALNTAGAVTRNYTSGDFLKLDASSLVRTPAANDDTARDAQGNPFPVTATLAGMAFSNLGAGRVQYRFSSADSLVFDKTVDSLVAPFNPDYSIELTRLADSDGVTASPQTPVELAPSFGFEMRYGRLSVDNAYGPETLDLIVPFRATYYTGSGFVVNEPDSCWAYATATDVSLDDSGLSGGSTSVIARSDTLDTGRPPVGSELILSAPGEGNTGDVPLIFSAPVWLQGDYDENGTLENPSALATFGVYRGHDRVIYWREQ